MPFITIDQNARRAAEWGNEETEIPPGASEAILRILPERFRESVMPLIGGSGLKTLIEELRFRVGKKVQLVTASGEIMLTDRAPFSESEAKEMLTSICERSVYAKENELVGGYVSLPGGVRVGIAGRPVVVNGEITHLTAVSSFNIRVPRQMIGCAEPFMPYLVDERKRPVSAVIAAPPGEGKTTFLRDCCRCFSNGVNTVRPFVAAVSDERNELSGSVNGIASLDLGERTDVMTGVKKAKAIPLLVRSMAPDVIITDELFGKDDMSAIAAAISCGTAVIASIHAGSEAELFSKKWLQAALRGLPIRLFMLKRVGRRFILNEVSRGRS